MISWYLFQPAFLWFRDNIAVFWLVLKSLFSPLSLPSKKKKIKKNFDSSFLLFSLVKCCCTMQEERRWEHICVPSWHGWWVRWPKRRSSLSKAGKVTPPSALTILSTIGGNDGGILHTGGENSIEGAKCLRTKGNKKSIILQKACHGHSVTFPLLVVNLPTWWRTFW